MVVVPRPAAQHAPARCLQPSLMRLLSRRRHQADRRVRRPSAATLRLVAARRHAFVRSYRNEPGAATRCGRPTVDEFVRDEIADDEDARLAEAIDDLEQSCRFVGGPQR